MRLARQRDLPSTAQTAAEVIGAADQALYAAKRGGRNLCKVA